jgi:hypothetical protein
LIAKPYSGFSSPLGTGLYFESSQELRLLLVRLTLRILLITTGDKEYLDCQIDNKKQWVVLMTVLSVVKSVLCSRSVALCRGIIG